jgi:hypothetical protein
MRERAGAADRTAAPDFAPTRAAGRPRVFRGAERGNEQKRTGEKSRGSLGRRGPDLHGRPRVKPYGSRDWSLTATCIQAFNAAIRIATPRMASVADYLPLYAMPWMSVEFGKRRGTAVCRGSGTVGRNRRNPGQFRSLTLPEDGPVEFPQRTTNFHDPGAFEQRGASGYSAVLSADSPSTTLLRTRNKTSWRHVYDYVDACVRDEPRDAFAMDRQFSIFVIARLMPRWISLRGISRELPQEE